MYWVWTCNVKQLEQLSPKSKLQRQATSVSADHFRCQVSASCCFRQLAWAFDASVCDVAVPLCPCTGVLLLKGLLISRPNQTYPNTQVQKHRIESSKGTNMEIAKCDDSGSDCFSHDEFNPTLPYESSACWNQFHLMQHSISVGAILCSGASSTPGTLTTTLTYIDQSTMTFNLSAPTFNKINKQLFRSLTGTKPCDKCPHCVWSYSPVAMEYGTSNAELALRFWTPSPPTGEGLFVQRQQELPPASWPLDSLDLSWEGWNYQVGNQSTRHC